MKKLTFLLFDAGGGHRSSATSLRQVIEHQQRPWEVCLLNLQELMDDIDPWRKVTGRRMQDGYNRMLETGRTFGSAQLLRLLHCIARLYHRKTVEVLSRHWEQTRPDMVVSLIPHFNRAIAQSIRQVLPGTPFVTILTDLADYPPHYWMERQSELLICGTDTAVRQALAMGHAPSQVFRASGMILNPHFYEQTDLDRAEERVRLGLDPNRPTALVLFGGCGADVMQRIVERLDEAEPNLDLQLILICGRNEDLAHRLRHLRTRMPLYVEGFTRNVPYYMGLADFFIGKTGPASISEAVAMQLPVIVERNAKTLPQERYNANWILENQVGLVLRSFRGIVPAVVHLLRPGVLAAYRNNAATISNRAVFEIPDFLEQILMRSASLNNSHRTSTIDSAASCPSLRT